MILKSIKYPIFVLIFSAFFFGCKTQSTSTSTLKKTATLIEKELIFSENKEIIPLEERNRRKFDNAVIADLDQDGFLDLLLTLPIFKKAKFSTFSVFRKLI